MPYIGAGLTRFNTADELTVTGTSEFNNTITATTADNNAQLVIKSTDDDAVTGPLMELYRDSASPAVSDPLGRIEWKGKNDAGEDVTYSFIDTFIRDVTDGSEDGELRFIVMRDGTTREALMLGESNVVFNEGGLDINVRMESDSNTSMFFLDAGNNTVGIGTSDATNPLTVRGDGGTGTSAAIRFRDESNQGATLGVFNAGNVCFNAEQGDIFFNFNTVGKFEFKSGGDLEITDGNLKVASGHGIDFSSTANAGNSASMSAELFDDYEEGTWTPSPNASTGNSPSFGSVSGLYTKIGRMVFIRGQIANIDTSGTTSSAQLRVDGLPFTVDGSFGMGEAISDNITLQGGRTQLSAQVGTSEFITFTQSGNSLSETPTDMADVDSSSSDIFFSAFYYSNE